jgi:hypothetical protein
MRAEAELIPAACWLDERGAPKMLSGVNADGFPRRRPILLSEKHLAAVPHRAVTATKPKK